MAIAGRTATVAENASATSVTATLPTDRQSGDLCIVVFALTCTVAQFTGPGGSWVQVVAPIDTGAGETLAVYRQFTPGSAPSASSSGAAGRVTAICQSYSGVDTTTPIDVAASSTSGTATSINAPSVTTATNYALLLSVAAADTSPATRSWVTPSGMTMVKQPTVSGRSAGLAEELRTTAGATGTRNWTHSPSASLAMAAANFALRPATIAGDASSTITANTTAAGVAGPAASSTITASTTAVASLGASAAASSTITASATVAASYGARTGATSTITAGAVAAAAVGSPPFPQTPLPIHVYLTLGGVATDITAYTYGRNNPAITITRGRTAEGATTERQTAQLELNNRDGRFSPRNPLSPYYGQLTRNVPLTITYEEGGPYLSSTGQTTDYASTPDSAALSITGDIDLRADVFSTRWDLGGSFVTKYDEAAGYRSFSLWADGTGLVMTWSADSSTYISAVSADLPVTQVGRLAVRATLDVDNGAGGYTVTFYTASTIDGPWRQLGDPVTGASTTSIADTTAALTVAGAHGTPSLRGLVSAHYYSAEVRNGIDGTLVANPVFADQIVGATVFFDDQGNTWTINGSASLTNLHTAFTGEVSEWPQKWDTTGRDAWVPIVASGVIRRLSQGQSPVSSVLSRAIKARANVVGYWPCEDGTNSQSVASAIAGVRSLVVTDTSATGGTAPSFSSNTAFKASAPIPVLNTGRFDGVLPKYTATGETQVRWLMQVPSGGTTDLAQIVKVYCSGTAAKWEIVYGTLNGGSVQINAYDRNDVSILTGGFADFDLDGRALYCSLTLTQSGSNINYSFTAVVPGASGGSATDGTLNSRTVGVVQRFVFNKHNDLGGTAIGHISVEKDVTSIFDLGTQLKAYLGETAGARMQRLSTENGETFTIVGNPNDTHRMGYQTVDTYLNLMRECAETDGGVLYEPKDSLGLAYRTRRMLERQNPKVSLSYPGHQMMELEPTEDDRSTRNVVTVTRKDGGAATAELTTGALSTQDPPDGVGKYDTSVTVSLSNDIEAERQAYWRLALGTVDEARYPTLRVNLASQWMTADPALVREVLDLDVGDRITVTDPPLWVPPEAITQLVEGYTERLGQYAHEFVWNLAPESPYRVGIYDDGVSRYSSDGTYVAGSHTSGTTSLVVVTPVGPGWSHADGDFDILVSGERMTVTGIADYANPITNPSLESAETGWGNFSANATRSRVTGSTGYDGTAFERLAWTGANVTGQGLYYVGPSVTVGQTYVGSMFVRTNIDQVMYLGLEWKDGGGSILSITSGSATTCAANTWTQIYATGTAPASTATVTLTAYSHSSGVAWANTNTLDADAAALHPGSTPVGYPIGDQVQTFTVTRAVNGIVKAQTDGTTVELIEPYWYAL